MHSKYRLEKKIETNANTQKRLRPGFSKRMENITERK